MFTTNEIPKSNNTNSNHQDLKINFWAELVPKSFSIKVATAIDKANNMMYSPEAEVEKSALKIFFKKFMGSIRFIIKFY